MDDEWFEGLDEQAVDMIGTFGEAVEIHALRSPKDTQGAPDVNARKVVDATRLRQDICASFEDMHASSRLGFSEVEVSQSNPYISIRECDLEWMPCKGDRVRRCRNRKRYEVTDIQPDGMGCVMIILVEIQRTVS